jgi:DNA-binding PadR family transcriptional regulator
MSTISNLEAALLGLLTERPMHPYEIEKTVVDRDMRLWAGISMSSIYKVLGKLETKLLVDVRVEVTEAHQAKKVYTITGRGRKEVGEKVRELVSEVENFVCRIDIGLHNLHLLTDEEARTALSAYIRSVDEKIRFYHEVEECLAGAGCPVHRIALVRRRGFLLQAERAWAESFLDEFGRAADPGQATTAEA